MKIRRFEEADLAFFKNVPPIEVRGDKGFTVYAQHPIACGFLIPTTTELCLYEFVDVNSSYSDFTRAKAVRFLTLSVISLAKELGFKILIGYTPSDRVSLINMYKRMDCAISDKTYRTIAKEL